MIERSRLSAPAFSLETAQRDALGQTLVELGRHNPEVVVLTADLGESLRLQAFAKEFPQRYFELGVAEQNLMGVAAGMALTGKIPFVCSFAVFSPGRSWDQLRVSVCYAKANVKVIGGHVGFSNGGDGGTHQALEDIAITRCLPHLVVLSPADASQTAQAVLAAAEHRGPVYLRVSRSAPYQPLAGWSGTANQPFQLGKAQILRSGEDVTIVATGLMVNEAMRAAQQLDQLRISAEVINLHTIKPIDREALLHSLKKTGVLVTIEEHQQAGGCGSAILEALAGKICVPMALLGVNDQFGESGQPLELVNKHHLNAEGIQRAVEHLLHR